jgi:hypothetical protein
MSIFYNGVKYELGKPQNGDLLFRWLPKGLPKDTQKDIAVPTPTARHPNPGQREPEHQLIELKQRKSFQDEEDYLSNLQHVGIWHEDKVIEVGGMKICRNDPSTRSHYDVVLRSPFADRISHTCSQLRLPVKQTYPVNDLWKISNNPKPTTRGKIDQIWAKLSVEKEVPKLLARGEISYKHQPRQKVVCSHFVHAVLYAAAYPGGTIAVATSHEYNDYFKICPEHLYRQYLKNEGGTVISKFRFIFVGMQHKGILIPYRALYLVGWRSDENILPAWAKLNVITIFHNELNDWHSMIEDSQNGQKTVIPAQIH